MPANTNRQDSRPSVITRRGKLYFPEIAATPYRMSAEHDRRNAAAVGGMGPAHETTGAATSEGMDGPFTPPCRDLGGMAKVSSPRGTAIPTGMGPSRLDLVAAILLEALGRPDVEDAAPVIVAKVPPRRTRKRKAA